jgi:hypothetical protein
VTIRDMVLGLLDLPGSRYSCVAERESGRILIESGAATIDPVVVLRWGTEASNTLGMTSDGGMEDFILTSSGQYHLVRPLGSDRSLLVYLCVDRARANLASARRELAAARLDERGPGAATMVQERPPSPRLTPRRPAFSRTAAAMPPAAYPAGSPLAARREPVRLDVLLPRRTGSSPLPVPQQAPPPVKRPGAGPAVGRRRRHDESPANGAASNDRLRRIDLTKTPTNSGLKPARIVGNIR